MQQTNNEFELLVKLKYPDPTKQAEEFIDAMPDDFVEEYLYTGKTYTVEEKREYSKAYFRGFTNTDLEAQKLFDLLVEYHSKKDNTSA